MPPPLPPVPTLCCLLLRRSVFTAAGAGAGSGPLLPAGRPEHHGRCGPGSPWRHPAPAARLLQGKGRRRQEAPTSLHRPLALCCMLGRLPAVLNAQPHACAMSLEALLLRKALHLTCDEGQARILSPARFAIMCNAGGCLLENLVLKSHQVGVGSAAWGGCQLVAPTPPLLLLLSPLLCLLRRLQLLMLAPAPPLRRRLTRACSSWWNTAPGATLCSCGTARCSREVTLAYRTSRWAGGRGGGGVAFACISSTFGEDNMHACMHTCVRAMHAAWQDAAGPPFCC